MMQPRFVVYAVRQLHESREVLCTKIKRSLRAAEIEALIFTKLAFCVFPQMALQLLLWPPCCNHLRQTVLPQYIHLIWGQFTEPISLANVTDSSAKLFNRPLRAITDPHDR
jgi:hypothetical protein